MDRAQFGSRIRDLRKQAGLTQADLGSLISMTGQAVGHWEKGRSLPPATDVPRVAAALGVTICALYGVQEEHKVNTQAGLYATEQPGRIAGMVTGNLIEGWARLPPPEQEFLREITAAASRLRERLTREEGL